MQRRHHPRPGRPRGPRSAPEQREAAGKDSTGLITLEARDGDDGVEIVVRDDGRGFDLEALARARGLDPATLDAGHPDWIFEAGASTRSKVDELAGRGVGLSAVHRELQAIGYGIELDTASGGARLRIRGR
ncbi:MAG: hypothetical protein KC431_23265 [Myxococcales bacterium]|nr:hypothetical protein [Myxococcales bacterium]